MRPRLAVAAVGFALAVCVSYAALRLMALGDVEPAGAVVRNHIPFFWRTGLAAVHGVAAGTAAFFWVRDPEWVLDRAPPAIVAVAAGCAALMVAFP